MRKLILVAAVALTASLALAACNKQSDQQAAQQTAQQAPKPSDANDAKAWNAYLGQIVQKNMQGMTANQPYAYLVKAPDSDDAKAQNERQLQSIQDTVARGVLPGNMLAFAGPDSAATADLVMWRMCSSQPVRLRALSRCDGRPLCAIRVQQVLRGAGCRAVPTAAHVGGPVAALRALRVSDRCTSAPASPEWDPVH